VNQRPRAPFVDIRIEAPRSLALLDGLTVYGLTTINFHPPASGPEIELTFGTFTDGDKRPGWENFEEFIKGMVATVTAQTVLQSRVRNPDDPDPTTGVSG
jgi:hypothetical protein